MRSLQYLSLFAGLVFLSLACGKKESANTEPNTGGPAGGNTPLKQPEPIQERPTPEQLKKERDELVGKGFEVTVAVYLTVSVPPTLPLDRLKELNGRASIEALSFKPTFSGTEPIVTDAAIQGLSGLDGLRRLEFDNCPKITDAAFQNLGRFPKLNHVWVTKMNVGDGLANELANTPALSYLRMSQTQLTNAGLPPLTKLPRLGNLIIADTKVTGEGFQVFKSMESLEYLDLTGVRDADKGLDQLTPPKLRSLLLSGIGDDGLAKLPVLPRLDSLQLTNCEVSDTGVQVLKKQPKLGYLKLSNTMVTKAGTDELMKHFPKLEVGLSK